MGETSTAFNTCDAQILLADHNGEMVDISGQANNLDFEVTDDVGEYKTFGNRAKRRLVCGEDGSVKATIFMSQADGEAFSLIKRWKWQYREQIRRLIIRAPDGSIGSDQWEGYFVRESINWSVNAEEPAPTKVEISLLPSGPIDWSVVGTT